MKIILMILVFNSLLFSEERSSGSIFPITKVIQPINVDLFIKKDNDLNQKIAQSIKNQVLETQIIKQKNESSIVNQLSQDDSLRIGIISEEALLYQKIENESLNDKVKMLFPLYEKFIYIFVAVDSNISSLSDLKGKRVAMGKENSTSWFVGKVLQKEKGLVWNVDDSPINSKEDLKQISFKLLTNKIDAFIYVGDIQKNLVEQHFQANTGKKLKLIEISSENFYTKEILKQNHEWLDSDSKKILFSKELLVVHNFFYIEGETKPIHKNYEQIIKRIKTKCRREIKQEFNLNTRTQVKWKKWLDGSQISYKKLIQ